MRDARRAGRWVVATAAVAASACAAGAVAAPPAVRLVRLPPPSPHRAKARAQFDAHSVLVRFKESAGPAQRASALRAEGAQVERPLAHTGFVLVDTGKRSPRASARALRRDPGVAAVEPNYVRRADAITNDPLRAAYQPYLAGLRLPEAWDLGKGSDVGSIAILDTGVDLDHLDLAAHIVPGYDFVNGDGVAQDDEGHGTMVAGIGAALTNNGVGIAGAAWNARIMPVKVLDDFGEGTDAEVAAGIVWAADHGARVINLSLGGPFPSAVLDDACAYAIAHGSLVVAAAGNDGWSLPSYPAASPGVIAVAATGNDQAFALFSNYGPSSRRAMSTGTRPR